MQQAALSFREKTRRMVRGFFPSVEATKKRAKLDREAVDLAESLERVLESSDYRFSLSTILDEVRQELFTEIIDRQTEDDRFAKGGVAALDRIKEKIRAAKQKGATALGRLKAAEEAENVRRKREQGK